MAIRYLGEEGGRAYAESSEGEGDCLIVSFTPDRWLRLITGKWLVRRCEASKPLLWTQRRGLWT
ncbi:MAG: hypothetical protein ACI8Z1_000277 [Candidatus Azotimanducaceae bacterium]|jgi:hypothetical protein